MSWQRRTWQGGTIPEFGTSYYFFLPIASGPQVIDLTDTQSGLSWDLYDSGWNWIDGRDEWDFVAGAFTVTVTSP